MSLKLNVEINSGASWLLTFLAVNAYAYYMKVPFSEYWLPASLLYGWHSGRRLWKDLKLPNGTTVTNYQAEPGA